MNADGDSVIPAKAGIQVLLTTENTKKSKIRAMRDEMRASEPQKSQRAI
jgi:hypothetical protein